MPSHLNANVVPSQPNADVDLYAGYPKFVQDMFTLEQLKNTYSHPDLWPHHSFIETTRTSEIGMVRLFKLFLLYCTLNCIVFAMRRHSVCNGVCLQRWP